MTAEIAEAWEVHPWMWEVAVALDDHWVDQEDHQEVHWEVLWVQGDHWEVH